MNKPNNAFDWRACGYTANHLQHEKVDDVRYAIDDFAPEGLTILAGNPKAGKSWMALNLAEAVATGSLAFGEFDAQLGDVLLLLFEDNKRSLKKRLSQMWATSLWPERINIFDSCDGWPTFNEGGLAALEDWVANHPQAKLVIIDTLQRFLGAAGTGSNAYKSEYDVVGRLQSFALNYGIAVVVLHHTKKGRSDNTDWISEISGTFGLTGSADSLVLFRRDRSAQKGRLLKTGRLVDEGDYEIEMDGTTGRFTVKAHGPQQNPEQMRITAHLMNNGASKVADLYEGLGYIETKDQNRLRANLKRMVDKGFLAKEGDLYSVQI